jgi:hypothetical protein
MTDIIDNLIVYIYGAPSTKRYNPIEKYHGTLIYGKLYKCEIPTYAQNF